MQLTPWFAAALLALVNVVAFFAQGLDKWRAKRNSIRIRERTLLLFGLPFGALGMWLGMLAFRHKTDKTSFLIWAVLITLVNVALSVLVVWAARHDYIAIEQIHAP
jgi:uncharacterized membrane protein YsdA (DUF1294 family)